MASLGIATINVLARTTQFENSLRRSIKRVGIATAAILGGVAAGNFLQGAIKNSISLELQVAKIQTLIQDLAPQWQEAFNPQSLRALSNELGISVTEVGDALYYMLGSGVDAADAMDAVRAAASTAVATTSDLGLVANFTSSALNAFGGTTDRLTGQVVDAAHANDIFFSALKEGKATANDLAKYLSTAIPSAKGLGISLSEVTAAASAASLTGKSARKVLTGLDYIMVGLGNSSKGVGEAFKEITGKEFPDFVKAGGTLKDAIKILGSEIGIQQLSNLKGASTGLAAIKELLVVWDQYGKVQKNTAKTEGDAAAARDIVNQSLSRQLDFLKTRFSNFSGSVGDWLAPVVGSAIVGLAELGGKFKEIWPPIKESISNFVGDVVAIIQTLWPLIEPAFIDIKNALTSIDWKAWADYMRAVISGLAMGFSPLILAVVAVADALAILTNLINPILGILQQFAPVVAGVATAYAAWKVYGYAVIAVEAIKNAMLIANTVLTYAYIVAVDFWAAAQGTAAAAGGGLAGVMAVLNAVMAANPIGIVVVVLAALAGAFIYGWKTSEKFREFTVGAWNAIKDATLTAIKVMFNVMFQYFTIPIRLIQKLIGAVGHLPKWLGGGVADEAAGAVNAIVNGIDNIKDSLNGLIDTALEADWALSKVYNDDMGAQVSADALNDPAFLKTLKQAKNKIPKQGGGADQFAGGGYDVSGDAKKAADEAARAIKAALKRVLADLNRIAKNTSKQTVDTIKNNFETLYKDMADGKVSKKVIAAAKKMGDKLIALAKKRDVTQESLKLAREELKKLTDEATQFTASIKEQVNSLGSVAQASKGIATNFTGIRNQLRYAVASTTAFVQNINRLRQLGLNETSLKQLIEAGPQAAGDAARVLAASGQAGIGTINDLQGQLDTAAGALATSAYDQFFKAGIAQAQGIVNGLQSQEAALLAQMDKLGDRIAQRFKKALKIASPSKVFEDLGSMIPLGLSKGMDSGIPGVMRSTGGLVGATNNFDVTVNGVADPKAAHRAGILAGHGIKNVLTQKRNDQTLDGIG